MLRSKRRECDLLKRSGKKKKQDDGDEDPIRRSNLSCICTCFYMRPCHFYILSLAWYCLAHVLSRLVSCLLSLYSARCDCLFSYPFVHFLFFILSSCVLLLKLALLETAVRIGLAVRPCSGRAMASWAYVFRDSIPILYIFLVNEERKARRRRGSSFPGTSAKMECHSVYIQEVSIHLACAFVLIRLLFVGCGGGEARGGGGEENVRTRE